MDLIRHFFFSQTIILVHQHEICGFLHQYIFNIRYTPYHNLDMDGTWTFSFGFVLPGHFLSFFFCLDTFFQFCFVSTRSFVLFCLDMLFQFCFTWTFSFHVFKVILFVLSNPFSFCVVFFKKSPQQIMVHVFFYKSAHPNKYWFVP